MIMIPSSQDTRVWKTKYGYRIGPSGIKGIGASYPHIFRLHWTKFLGFYCFYQGTQ